MVYICLTDSMTISIYSVEHSQTFYYWYTEKGCIHSGLVAVEVAQNAQETSWFLEFNLLTVFYL